MVCTNVYVISKYGMYKCICNFKIWYVQMYMLFQKLLWEIFGIKYLYMQQNELLSFTRVSKIKEEELKYHYNRLYH